MASLPFIKHNAPPPLLMDTVEFNDNANNDVNDFLQKTPPPITTKRPHSATSPQSPTSFSEHFNFPAEWCAQKPILPPTVSKCSSLEDPINDALLKVCQSANTINTTNGTKDTNTPNGTKDILRITGGQRKSKVSNVSELPFHFEDMIMNILIKSYGEDPGWNAKTTPHAYREMYHGISHYSKSYVTPLNGDQTKKKCYFKTYTVQPGAVVQLHAKDIRWCPDAQLEVVRKIPQTQLGTYLAPTWCTLVWETTFTNIHKSLGKIVYKFRRVWENSCEELARTQKFNEYDMQIELHDINIIQNAMACVAIADLRQLMTDIFDWRATEVTVKNLILPALPTPLTAFNSETASNIGTAKETTAADTPNRKRKHDEP